VDSPGTFNPIIRPVGAYGFVVRIALFTATAWIPFVISANVSRSLLSSRDPKATAFFIVCATAITLAACGFYLGLFTTLATLSPIEISAGVLTLLAAVAFLCAFFWKDDAPDNFFD
jgi:hypothetical protein